MLNNLHSSTAMHSHSAQPPIQMLTDLHSMLINLHSCGTLWPHSLATEFNFLVISILCLLISILVLHYDLIVWYYDIIVLVIAKPPVEYK